MQDRCDRGLLRRSTTSGNDAAAELASNVAEKVSPQSQIASRTSAVSTILGRQSCQHQVMQTRDPIDPGATRAGLLAELPAAQIPNPGPTILTVEATANAKIFFETYYDPLLSASPSPRSIRRQALEKRLKTRFSSEEQREKERNRWRRAETSHLRQVRTQKSRMKRSARTCRATATAGFEALRILGKGSFGVVRLVREDNLAISDIPSVKPARAKRLDFHGGGLARQPMNRSLKASTQRDVKSRSVQKQMGEVYAMKVIRKSDMLRNCQEGHLRAERDFLVTSEKSRWVIPLIASFQDGTNLYLVMEYMVGGDFLGLLFRKNVLKEKHARWYIAEMLLCVEETHRRGWIHRDIKPDNFLISSTGHLKISDFGLAFDGHWSHDQRFFRNHRKSLMEKLGIEVLGDKEDQRDEDKKLMEARHNDIITEQGYKIREHRQMDGPCDDETILQWRNREGKRRMAASVVGTSQYMAPEVIRGESYDGRCDWWSIGIILYEVVTFVPVIYVTSADCSRPVPVWIHTIRLRESR